MCDAGVLWLACCVCERVCLLCALAQLITPNTHTHVRMQMTTEFANKIIYGTLALGWTVGLATAIGTTFFMHRIYSTLFYLTAKFHSTQRNVLLNNDYAS